MAYLFFRYSIFHYVVQTETQDVEAIEGLLNQKRKLLKNRVVYYCYRFRGISGMNTMAKIFSNYSNSMKSTLNTH